jgi:hypothetical protein
MDNVERQAKLLYEILEDCWDNNLITRDELEEIADYLRYLRNPCSLQEVGRMLENDMKLQEKMVPRL